MVGLYDHQPLVRIFPRHCARGRAIGIHCHQVFNGGGPHRRCEEKSHRLVGFWWVLREPSGEYCGCKFPENLFHATFPGFFAGYSCNRLTHRLTSPRKTPLERELEAINGISLKQLGQAGTEVRGRVSVVTPTTASRSGFHPELVDQSWPDKELVVVETYHGSW